MRIKLLLIHLVSIVVFSSTTTIAQIHDSIQLKNNYPNTNTSIINQSSAKHKKSFIIKPFIIPTAMITYGFLAINNKGLQEINVFIQKKVLANNSGKTTNADNFLPFTPVVFAYGLDALGIKSKHNFRDKTMLLLISGSITNATVIGLKQWINQLRPDGSNYRSFPSGHTAVAFSTAELLRLEYKHLSPWYGIAGYAIAVTSGYLRIHNNKHWVSDVVAGGGIGIACTKLAYLLHPSIQRKFFKKKAVNTTLFPIYNGSSASVLFIHLF